MFQVARAIVEILFDLVKLVVLFLRLATAIRTENLVLRKQLAAYVERGIKPRRLDHDSRLSLSVISKLFDVKNAIVIVRPSRWVRAYRIRHKGRRRYRSPNPATNWRRMRSSA